VLVAGFGCGGFNSLCSGSAVTVASKWMKFAALAVSKATGLKVMYPRGDHLLCAKRGHKAAPDNPRLSLFVPETH
jgi:hypothetical protein